MSTEKTSVNTLQFRHISEVTEETRKYIIGRKTGTEKSLKVNSSKVNKSLMDGFDWGRIITVAGSPGSGKSTLTRQWIREMVELNKEEKFEILSFQFEMLGLDEVARDLSSHSGMNIKEIYSCDTSLSDAKLKVLEKKLEEIKEYPISIVDINGTVRDIVDTIIYYVSSKKLIESKTGLVITIDHSLLVKGEKGEQEKDTLDNLMKSLVSLKKYLASIGAKVMYIVLSQLNRNIESNDRITNCKLHYPNKSDLYGASSVYYSSDYVFILHRPAIIEGLGNWYGPPKKNFPQGLPVFNPENPKQPMIYLHIIKERFGSNKIIPMLDELNVGKIVEYSFD